MLRGLSLTLAAAVICAAGATGAQQPQVPTPASWEPRQTVQAAQGDVVVLPVQGNVYLIVADGSNITVQIGPDGVLMVDTSNGKRNAGVFDAIGRLSDQPIRWIVNTSIDPAHTGGNEAFFKAGRSTPQNRFASGLGFPGSLPTGATIVAHESVLLKMSAPHGEIPPRPQGAWPTATFISGGKELHLNGEPIQVLHQPNAYSDGDSIVAFRYSDVVSHGQRV